MNRENNNILSRRIQELKEQYELKMESKTSILPMKLAKNACQSRVKEMTKVFNNNMMKQVLQRDAGEIKYKRFANDAAPQLQSSPIVPKLRSKFLPSSERVTPVAAKRTCMVTENAFNKLSVKDRVKLYSKFIEDLSKNEYNTETAPIIVEKEASVELILKTFEGKFNSTERESIKQPLKEMVNNFQKMPSKMNEYENLTYSGGKPIVNKELTPLKKLFYKWLSEHDESSYTKHVEHAELIPEIQTSSTIDTLKRSNINTFVENSLMKFETNNIKEVEDVMMETSNFCDYENIKQLITDKYMEDTLEKFLIDDTKQSCNFNYEEDSTVLIADKVVDSVALLLPDYSEDGNAINFDSPQSFKSTEISDADKFTDALTEIESEDSAPNNGEIVNIEDTESEEEPQKVILQAGALSKSLPPFRNIPFMTSESSGEDHSPVKFRKYTDSESGLSTLPKPPENELQKSHDQNPAALSEHQLRIQASLQRLNIPDWFRQYNQIQTSTSGGAGSATYRPGNFTRKRTQDSGRWAGLNSKTTSLSSLGSQRSDRSPLLLSPSAHSHHGGQSSSSQQHQHHPHHSHHVSTVVGGSGVATAGGAGAFSRWSTSHLNSSQISPCVSQRSSFSRGGPINSSFMSVASGHNSAIRNSMRQPYLGWRSQEKLSQRTAHERLASSLLSQHQHQQQQRLSSTTRQTLSCITNTDDDAVTAQAKLPPPITPEIQTSIKEVTSAIVHYVNDQTNQQRSRSTSPNSRKCWLESSFVGTRPLDSPQTPIIENTTFSTAAIAASGLLSITNNNNNNTTTPSLNNYQQYKITPTGIDIGIGDHHQHQHQHHHHHHHLASSSSVYNSSRIGNALGNEAVLTRMNDSGGLNNGATTATFGGSVSSGVAAGSVGIGVDNITGFGSLAAAPERSLSSASLEDVLTSLLGLSTTHHTTVTTTADPSGRTLASTNTINIDAFARSSTGGASASECLKTENKYKHMPQQQQQQQQITTANDYEQQKENIEQLQQQPQLLSVLSKEEQQHLRRRSEGDAPTQKAKQQQQQQQQQQQNQKLPQYGNNGKTYASDTLATSVAQAYGSELQNVVPNEIGFMPPRRISLGDSTESYHKTISASGELQIKCRNTKCDRTATPIDAKKYYKSCHNCTHLYCSRECRRAHWEKHRKACLHSRASNLCRQVLATCKDDVDSQRHLSFLARQGFLSQGRGVVRMLFRSAEAAEGFIKHGFQCMGEASYVRWPDLMPAEMGLELYSELLRFSTEYKPESKMLVYVAICVVSEAPSMGQAPVRWERQLVSRCAKLKLCKTVLTDYEQASSNRQQQHSSQPLSTINVHEPTTEVLILTFNPQLRSSTVQRELIFSNILTILSRRGVVLRRHYPEIFQRLQTFTEGQTDKFHPVTLHPRNSQTGQNFVCIIMPVQSENEIIKLPSAADGGNRVTTIDVGSAAAPMQLDDEEMLAEGTS